MEEGTSEPWGASQRVMHVGPRQAMWGNAVLRLSPAAWEAGLAGSPPAWFSCPPPPGAHAAWGFLCIGLPGQEEVGGLEKQTRHLSKRQVLQVDFSVYSVTTDTAWLNGCCVGQSADEVSSPALPFQCLP